MSRHAPHESGRRVVIAGGGVAALEAILALRALAGSLPAIELIAPVRELSHRPASVASPFGFGAPSPVRLEEFCAAHGVSYRQAALEAVDAGGRVARCDDGRELAFDHLLIAVGAHVRQGLPGSLAFRGPDDVGALAELLDEMGRRRPCRLAFALPRGSSWSLPLYELAILAAVELRARGFTDHQLTVVTHESSPLELFGAAAGAALTGMLEARGVSLLTGRAPRRVQPGELVLEDGTVVEADRVVSIPIAGGRPVPGVPQDADGFIGVDRNGRVTGSAAVFAAGDITDFPIKQGGLAAQQADAAAAAMAADMGIPGDPAPFRPVMRGLLLTGGAPLYLRAEPGADALPLAVPTPRAASADNRAAVGHRPLWWPPGKVAGRYLAPYLSTARPPVLATEPLTDRYPDPSPDTGSADRSEAVELALILADQDARCADWAQAVRALDAAAALAGGELPVAYAEKRDRWLAMLEPARRIPRASP